MTGASGLELEHRAIAPRTPRRLVESRAHGCTCPLPRRPLQGPLHTPAQTAQWIGRDRGTLGPAGPLLYPVETTPCESSEHKGARPGPVDADRVRRSTPSCKSARFSRHRREQNGARGIRCRTLVAPPRQRRTRCRVRILSCTVLAVLQALCPGRPGDASLPLTHAACARPCQPPRRRRAGI